MITEQHTQEQLSRAYITAVAGVAGVNLAYLREHDYGIDGTFRSVMVNGGRRREDGFALDFQLKSTVNCIERENVIRYNLDADTFNQLVRQDATQGTLPCIILVLCLPSARDEWLSATNDALILRHGCYWFRPVGRPTTNTRSRQIQIPRTQLFTPDALRDIMQRVVRGGKP